MQQGQHHLQLLTRKRQAEGCRTGKCGLLERTRISHSAMEACTALTDAQIPLACTDSARPVKSPSLAETSHTSCHTGSSYSSYQKLLSCAGKAFDSAD